MSVSSTHMKIMIIISDSNSRNMYNVETEIPAASLTSVTKKRKKITRTNNDKSDATDEG